MWRAKHKVRCSVHATGKASRFLNETALVRGTSEYNPRGFRQVLAPQKSFLIHERGTGMRSDHLIVAGFAALLVAGVASAQGNPQRPGRGEMPPGQQAAPAQGE